ncbi:hypothetical protein R3P38DRAFT_3344417 [Favolaschia claudopus]|uniref:Uncharacterized protein n=1 Tax=Favolaschia claudopus TaxID=2862362 RepID=A0AAW0DN02_9AGAR
MPCTEYTHWGLVGEDAVNVGGSRNSLRQYYAGEVCNATWVHHETSDESLSALFWNVRFIQRSPPVRTMRGGTNVIGSLKTAATQDTATKNPGVAIVYQGAFRAALLPQNNTSEVILSSFRYGIDEGLATSRIFQRTKNPELQEKNPSSPARIDPEYHPTRLQVHCNESLVAGTQAQIDDNSTEQGLRGIRATRGRISPRLRQLQFGHQLVGWHLLFASDDSCDGLAPGSDAERETPYHSILAQTCILV